MTTAVWRTASPGPCTSALDGVEAAGVDLEKIALLDGDLPEQLRPPALVHHVRHFPGENTPRALRRRTGGYLPPAHQDHRRQGRPEHSGPSRPLPWTYPRSWRRTSLRTRGSICSWCITPPPSTIRLASDALDRWIWTGALRTMEPSSPPPSWTGVWIKRQSLDYNLA